ncbi:MAG: cytochrome C oxidase subunit IV family protein [Thermoanaerobaculales bacterium]
MSTHEDSGVHVASVRLLVIVWIALIFGTWLTVSATYVDLGVFNIWIGLAIATAKAVLVALYYMHLRWDKPFNALVFLGAFFFLAIFIGIAMMDTQAYQPNLIPGYSPAMGSHLG